MAVVACEARKKLMQALETNPNLENWLSWCVEEAAIAASCAGQSDTLYCKLFSEAVDLALATWTQAQQEEARSLAERFGYCALLLRADAALLGDLDV
jgi:hypothetical protein